MTSAVALVFAIVAGIRRGETVALRAYFACCAVCDRRGTKVERRMLCAGLKHV